MRMPAYLNRALCAALALAGLVMALPGQAAGPAGPPRPTPTRATSSGSGSDTVVGGEILVKLRSTDDLAPLLSRYPVTLLSRFGARPIYRLKVVGNARINDLLATMVLDTTVMIAEANASQRSPEARQNVPWAVGNAVAYATQWAPTAMHLAEAQQLSTGAGVRVAVLDTGIDPRHPMLAGRLLPGFDFVEFDNDPSEGGSRANYGYGHGTHVAGLVALVAPNAKIMPIRTLDADGVGNAWVLAEAILYALDPDGNPATDDGAQVINISLGSLSRTRILDTIARIAACEPAVAGDPAGDRSDAGYNADHQRCGRGLGAVVVAAAGNDGSSNVKQYPAAEGASGLLAVTATKPGNRLAGFANSGSWVGLAAPGEGITSSVPGGGLGTWSGTSMATPLVAGTAALLRAYRPTLPTRDLIRQMQRAGNTVCGSNLLQVDAAAALTGMEPLPAICR